jgi:hypothetical protein
MKHIRHVTTYLELGRGRYLVTCDNCPYRLEVVGTRNDAHRAAFEHTVNPEPKEGTA